MEYLRQQFERVMYPSHQQQEQMSQSLNVEADSDLHSPWQNDPSSLHFSSFGPPTTFDSPAGKYAARASQQNQKRGLFQKETQTETTLFEDPFRSSFQQYRLFGEPKDEESESKLQQRNYDFTDVIEPTSPGVVGDRHFTGEQQRHYQQQQQQQSADDVSDDVMFPYRLRVSEYNPLSYQGK